MNILTPDVRDQLRHSLSGHEGLMLKVYDDATGKVVNPGTLVKGWLTIGYGRNLVGRGITKDEAEHLLSNDIDVVERELQENFPEVLTWTDARKFAFAEITYNLGVARFIRLFPNTTADLRAGAFARAGGRLRVSKWRKDVGDGRALPLIRILETGAWT